MPLDVNWVQDITDRQAHLTLQELIDTLRLYLAEIDAVQAPLAAQSTELRQKLDACLRVTGELAPVVQRQAPPSPRRARTRAIVLQSARELIEQHGSTTAMEVASMLSANSALGERVIGPNAPGWIATYLQHSEAFENKSGVYRLRQKEVGL